MSKNKNEFDFLALKDEVLDLRSDFNEFSDKYKSLDLLEKLDKISLMLTDLDKQMFFINRNLERIKIESGKVKRKNESGFNRLRKKD